MSPLSKSSAPQDILTLGSLAFYRMQQTDTTPKQAFATLVSTAVALKQCQPEMSISGIGDHIALQFPELAEIAWPSLRPYAVVAVSELQQDAVPALMDLDSRTSIAVALTALALWTVLEEMEQNGEFKERARDRDCDVA